MGTVLQFVSAGFWRAPVLWTGTTVISVLLIATLVTRWGRTQSLGRCILLSLLGHLWLAACSATVLVAERPGPRGETVIAISTLPPDLDVDETTEPLPSEPLPTEPLPTEPVPEPDPIPEFPPVEPQEPEPKGPELPPQEVPEAAPVAEPPQDILRSEAASSPETAPPLAASDELPVPTEADALPLEPEPTPAPAPEPTPALPVATSEPAPPVEPVRTATPAQPARPEVPALYRGRVEPERAKLVAQAGGDERTEAAVTAALQWLAANQAEDGRWDARRHGAGRELQVHGRDRAGAGARADTGVTGLALLAFLGAGHTHRHGEHRQTVSSGVTWLVRSQGADGNLGGDAEIYSFMYCHGMAACALSECYVLTRDPALEEPVRRAIGYIVRAQHPTTGGWRYRPGDRGDASVFGWQLMALKSAEAAGIAIPPATRDGMVRFLHSVGGGRHGGLASYRPGEAETRTMTAEALASRQFLGMLRSNPAADEAGDYVLGDIPRADRANYYYWYYATMAMHQLGGRHWEDWNRGLARTLVDMQITSGSLAGSWAPSDAWGGYGGRVYSTALAALSLEVYYRFLPLYGPREEVAERQ